MLINQADRSIWRSNPVTKDFIAKLDKHIEETRLNMTSIQGIYGEALTQAYYTYQGYLSALQGMRDFIYEEREEKKENGDETI